MKNRTINMQFRKSLLFLVMWMITGTGLFVGSNMGSIMLGISIFFGLVINILMYFLSEDFFDFAEDFTISSGIIACVVAFFTGIIISGVTPGAREMVSNGEVPYGYVALVVGHLVVGLATMFFKRALFSANNAVSGALIGGVLIGFISIFSLTLSSATPSNFEVIVVTTIVSLSAGYHLSVFSKETACVFYENEKHLVVTEAVFMYYNIIFAVPAYISYLLKKVAKVVQ